MLAGINNSVHAPPNTSTRCRMLGKESRACAQDPTTQYRNFRGKAVLRAEGKEFGYDPIVPAPLNSCFDWRRRCPSRTASGA